MSRRHRAHWRHLASQRVAAFSAFLLIARLVLIGAVLAGAGVVASGTAEAHSVGLRNTRVFMDPDTSQMLTDRALGSGQGVLAGDVLEYVVEFEPYDNGADFGPNGWVTFYPPPWAEVVGASFVDMIDNDFVDIPVPEPGEMWDGVGSRGGELPYGAPFDATLDGSLAQLYGDTGIFFSSSPDTAKYVGGADPATTPLGNNGYFVDPTACGQLEPAEWDNCWAHNLWDKEMTDRMGTSGGSIINSGRGTTPYLAGSPVAGPDSYYSLDYTGSIGPWQRIQYPGSMIGTGPVPDPADGDGPIAPTASTAWVPVTAGVNDGRLLNEANPLPAGTTAVRFAVGELEVLAGTDDYMWVKLRLRVVSTPPTCTTVDAEVFGGDAGVADNGKDHPWRYYVPISAVNSSCLVIDKGGPAFVATDGSLVYSVDVVNSSPDPLTDVVISDTIDPNTTFVAASDGGVFDGGSDTITWPTIASLAPGAGVSYTVEVTAPAGSGVTITNQSFATSNETAFVFSVWETVVVDDPVSGHVYRDDDGNGNQDPGEPDLPNIDVVVTDVGSSQTLTTDADGNWTAAVLAGPVTIDVVDATVPADLTLSTANDPQTVTAVAGGNTSSDPVGYEPVPPTISVTKSAPGIVYAPGGAVTFTVDVANTSPEEVTLTSLLDDVFGNLLDAGNGEVANNTCVTEPKAIPLGGSFTCSFDGDVTGNVGDPDHVNTVTATVDDGEGNLATDSDSTTVALDHPPPSIVVSKTPSAGTVAEPGGTVTFTVDVANTSGEAVTIIVLSDDLFGNLLDAGNGAVANNTCATEPKAIPLGGSFTCSFDALVAGSVGDPPHVNTVTATVDDGEAKLATDSDSATVAFGDPGLPSVSVTKTPSAGSISEPGRTVTFTVDVANTSSEAVTLTSLSDDLFGNLFDAGNGAVANNTCATEPKAIPLGGSFTCSFDALVAGSVGDPPHVNTVTATVDDGEGNTATDSDSATVAFGDEVPTVVVTKTPSAGTVAEPGGTVTFTVDVTNTSSEAVTLTSLSDDLFGNLFDAGNGAVANNTCATEPKAIPLGGSFTCSFDALVAGNFGDPPHVNTVTATVDDGEGNTATDSDSATVAFGDEVPTVVVTKTPSVGSISEPGGTVTFTVEVENTSPDSITLTDLVDDVFGDLLDPAYSDVANSTCDTGSTLIVAGGTFSCVFDGNVDGSFGGPDHVNTVTATVEDGQGNVGTGSGDATVTFDDVPPTLNVWKIADPGSVPEPGATVTFTVEVDNTSQEEVSLTALRDDVFGDLLDPLSSTVSSNTCPTAPSTIGVAGTFTCSFDAFVAGDYGDPDHVNTVTATVDDGDGNTETGSGTETVPFDAADGTLTGHLFVDSDGDGSQDADEPDLPGIDVIVTDADGITYTVTSDTDGDWSVDVALGDAHLAVDPLTVPGGYELTTDNETQTVTVPPDGTASDPIGYQPEPASLSGRVFLDLNGDVVQTAPEPGLAGVTVNLLDSSGVEIATTDTDVDGDYRFGGLEPGTYTVEVDERTVLDGLVLSGDPDGVLDAETTVTLEAGDSEDDLDFAYEGTGSIGDTVWLDEDEDGVEDPGEDPISGVVVELRWAGFDGVFGTSDDWVFPVEVTGADGLYRFWDLPPGKYRVEVDLDTVSDDLAPTTPIDFSLDLAASEDYDDGDAGFALRNDEPLPQTGIEAQTLGLWGIILTLAGLLLLLLGRRRRVTVRWDRL